MVDGPSFVPEDRSLLIVERSLYAEVSPEIDAHIAWLDSTGGRGFLELADAGIDPEELRVIIGNYDEAVDSVFLVGDLPAVWYEQTAFGSYEYFPVDVYYMDPRAQWTDADGNSYYDGHSELLLTVAVSRLNGGAAEIRNYFSKLDDYRRGAAPQLSGAYIFKDNDWYDFQRGSAFGLESIYPDVTISQDDTSTSREAYLDYLSSGGADYVYQWIHANPSALYFNSYDAYDIYSYYQVDDDIRGRFMNMFNCKGVRFTQPNMGMSYLTRTDLTLAITGSTKVGGNFYPLEFHRELSIGNSWGQAFVNWYNKFGKYDDEWFLGMVILGDPSLRIREADPQTGVSRSALQAVLPPLKEQSDALGSLLMEFDQTLEEPSGDS
jgi:hypothetical protein